MAIVQTYEPINLHDYSDDFTTCESYGMSSGCDADCPVLWRGECEEVLAVLDSLDIDSNTYIDILSNYATYKPRKEEPTFKTIW